MVKIKNINNKKLKRNIIEYREYQDSISDICLEKNTLVILPTALGKTIIAILTAVKLLDKDEKIKILMLAPTRPLVVQHLNTFKNLLNYNNKDFTILTGKILPKKRLMAWNSAKFIFATPQVIRNDLQNKRYNLKDIGLIIFDEAHHARKNYAYNYIASEYIKGYEKTRILGLTASPGKDEKSINEICENLFIEAIQFRSEYDDDVKDYITPITLFWHRLELPEEYNLILKILRDMVEENILKLKRQGLLIIKSTKIITKTDILELGKKLRVELNRATRRKKGYLYNAIVIQSALLSLMHGIELIETQGLLPFCNFLRKIEKDALHGKSKYSKLIVDHLKFEKLTYYCEFYRHILNPKLEKLAVLIKQELQENANSKIIVFSQYRDTVIRIQEYLKTIDNVKAIKFVGQTSKENDPGLKQDEQARIIEDFKGDKYNVLIATCVAEEGLDIPAVDRVIFFEPIPSEIRYIQRKGRTSRHHIGRVDILLNKNTIDEAYFGAALSREKKMKKIIKKLNKKLEK
ncbi:MAG: DEAD/DEAH box helicase [Candidatus Helarchaeota archaeon]